MKEEYKKYLPLGSVVLLKDATKKVMITGFVIKSIDTGDRIWDYIGCLYPEGIVTLDNNLLFDHDDIFQVISLGYSDDEQKEYNKLLEDVVKNEDNMDFIEIPELKQNNYEDIETL